MMIKNVKVSILGVFSIPFRSTQASSFLFHILQVFSKAIFKKRLF